MRRARRTSSPSRTNPAAGPVSYQPPAEDTHAPAEPLQVERMQRRAGSESTPGGCSDAERPARPTCPAWPASCRLTSGMSRAPRNRRAARRRRTLRSDSPGWPGTCQTSGALQPWTRPPPACREWVGGRGRAVSTASSHSSHATAAPAVGGSGGAGAAPAQGRWHSLEHEERSARVKELAAGVGWPRIPPHIALRSRRPGAKVCESAWLVCTQPLERCSLIRCCPASAVAPAALPCTPAAPECQS